MPLGDSESIPEKSVVEALGKFLKFLKNLGNNLVGDSDTVSRESLDKFLLEFCCKIVRYSVYF